MWSWFRSVGRRWADWCGDHEMENAIRRHLSSEGYYGGTAKLRGVKLAAVQRPGWLQVFRFDATARVAANDDDEQTDGRRHTDPIGSHRSARPDSLASPHRSDAAVYHDLYGLVREDQRSGRVDVRVFRSGDERRELFGRWGEGLLQLRGGQALGANRSG